MSEEEINVQEQEKARPLWVSSMAFISPGACGQAGLFPKIPLHLLTAYPIGMQIVLALAHHPIVCDECICVYRGALSQATASVLL